MAMRVGGLRAVLLSLALVGATLAPRPASAAPRANAVEKLADDAVAAYKAGDYQRAVDLLERAYAAQPLTALLYNLAKAHDKLGNADKARSLYQKYVAADDADPKLRARAEQRVAALRGGGESPRQKDPPTTVATTEPTTPTRTPPSGEPKSPPARNTPPPPPETVLITPSTFEPPPLDPLERERRARWRDRGLAITFGIVGVGAIGAAIGLSVSALDLQHQFDRSLDETQKRQLRDDGKTRALVADILYPVGAVAIAVGAVFLWRGLRPIDAKHADKPTTQLLPVILPGGGGLVVGGTY